MYCEALKGAKNNSWGIIMFDGNEQSAKNDKKNQRNIRKIKIKQRTRNQREKDLKSKGDIKKCYKVVQRR